MSTLQETQKLESHQLHEPDERENGREKKHKLYVTILKPTSSNRETFISSWPLVVKYLYLAHIFIPT